MNAGRIALNDDERAALGLRMADCGCCYVVDITGLEKVLSAREPHAYGVEVLVNAGYPSEYWRLGDEATPRETQGDAEDDRTDLIDEGYRPEHLRVVALVVA